MKNSVKPIFDLIIRASLLYYRPFLEKDSKQLIVPLYTISIYQLLCSQSADPNPFRHSRYLKC